MNVEISFEDRRWCGFRSPAKNGLGLYLIGPAHFEPCERIPFALETCPCCGAGIAPSRSYTWINPGKLFDPWEGQPSCSAVTGRHIEGLDHDHDKCCLCNPVGVAGDKAGLLWIGEQHYKTARLFMEEAMRMGISRKIPVLPNGFEVGVHYIYLAHRKTSTRFVEGKQEWVPGVFTAFKPIRLDIVIDDPDDVPPRAAELAQRLGDRARLVKVIPIDEGHGGHNDGDED